MSTCTSTDDDGDFIKDPDEKLDYQNDWSNRLTTGETIATSEWIIAPTGLTDSAPANTATTATVWLAGGDLGKTYTVTNRVTTNQGRTWDKTRHCYIDHR